MNGLFKVNESCTDEAVVPARGGDWKSIDLQSLRDKITELEEVGTNIGVAIVTNMKQGMQYAPEQYKR
jgi:hypothetical protein